MNTTKRPSPLMSVTKLGSKSGVCSSVLLTLTRSVVPAWRSRTNTSYSSLVSPTMRFEGLESKATNRPFALIASSRLLPFPSTPELPTLTRSVALTDAIACGAIVGDRLKCPDNGADRCLPRRESHANHSRRCQNSRDQSLSSMQQGTRAMPNRRPPQPLPREDLARSQCRTDAGHPCTPGHLEARKASTRARLAEPTVSCVGRPVGRPQEKAVLASPNLLVTYQEVSWTTNAAFTTATRVSRGLRH
jgi:hypothetical protein